MEEEIEKEEEGQEEELSAEEIASLKEKAAKAEELEKSIAETQAKLKELEEDENSKDWRKARRKMEAMEKALNKEGKIIDDSTFEVKSQERKFSPEDIDARVRALVAEESVRKNVVEAQKDLSEEDKAIFNRNYAKVVHGETVTVDNVDQFIDMAYRLSDSGSQKTAAERSSGTRGGAPRVKQESKSFADSEAGSAVLAKLGANVKTSK